MSARWLLPLFPFALVCLARADGPADNQLDKVRPVPPKGITVAEADRAVILAGLDELGLEIDACESRSREVRSGWPSCRMFRSITTRSATP